MQLLLALHGCLENRDLLHDLLEGQTVQDLVLRFRDGAAVKLLGQFFDCFAVIGGHLLEFLCSLQVGHQICFLKWRLRLSLALKFGASLRSHLGLSLRLLLTVAVRG